MNRNNKRALYESIMKNVAKLVKKTLNETEYLEEPPAEINLDIDDLDDFDIDGMTVDTEYGTCTVNACFDADTKGDYYEVTDEDGNYVCELPWNNDITDEDDLIEAIEDAADFESGSGDYEDTDPLGYWDGSDDDDDDEDDAESDDYLDENIDDEDDMQFDDYIEDYNSDEEFDEDDSLNDYYDEEFDEDDSLL